MREALSRPVFSYLMIATVLLVLLGFDNIQDGDSFLGGFQVVAGLICWGLNKEPAKDSGG